MSEMIRELNDGTGDGKGGGFRVEVMGGEVWDAIGDGWTSGIELIVMLTRNYFKILTHDHK
jgi:hypothetical protein